jgi:hypothetical protein
VVTRKNISKRNTQSIKGDIATPDSSADDPLLLLRRID